jgi:hypothetical protein
MHRKREFSGDGAAEAEDDVAATTDLDPMGYTSTKFISMYRTYESITAYVLLLSTKNGNQGLTLYKMQIRLRWTLGTVRHGPTRSSVMAAPRKYFEVLCISSMVPPHVYGLILSSIDDHDHDHIVTSRVTFR